MNTCHNETEADDLVQNVFEILLKTKLSNIRDSLIKYAHVIMRNRCAQWIKERTRMRALIVPPKSDNDSDDDDIQANQPEPGDELVQDEVCAKVSSIIEDFFEREPKHWKFIRLKHIDKLSHKEIAVELGISVGMSKKKLHKAVTALRKLCDKHNITSEELRLPIRRYYYEMPEAE